MSFTWPDSCRGALSMTYDDGLSEHHRVVGPALEQRGFRGTFYVSLDSNVLEEPDAWRGLAATGHELGNHTVFHPCRKEADLADAEWIDHCGDMCGFSLERWEREVRVASGVLRMLDGRDSRSYGNTCHDETVGVGSDEVSLIEPIEQRFSAGRGRCVNQIVNPATCRMGSLGCFGADGRSFTDLKPEVDAALACGGWLIYCLHSVGTQPYHLCLETAEHERLLDYFAERAGDLWVAPVDDVACWVRSQGKS